MWYWNQDNFEALDSFAKELAKQPRLKQLSEHYALREKGLRKQAFAALDGFLEQASAWTVAQQRSLATFLVDTQLERSGFHQLMPHPLQQRFLLPALERWLQEEPRNPLCLRSLGVARRSQAHLTLAVELDPNDSGARYCLVNWLLNGVDYALHELPGGLLGKPQEIFAELDQVDSLLDNSPVRPDLHEVLSQESTEYRQVLSVWLEQR